MAVNEISNAYVKTFEANVIHLVQQKESRLRRTVTEKHPGPTEKHSFRTVSARGAMTARNNVGTNAGKRQATPFADTVYNDRACFTAEYGTADSFSRADTLRMINDPKSIMTTSMAAQVGRKIDEVIITALFGNAPDSAGNANALPVAQQLGGAATAPSFALVRNVRKKVLAANISPQEEVFFVVTPDFITELLDDPKATSFDYANGKALMSGEIVQGWMGFTWITHNDLTKPVAGPPAQVYGAAYTKDAVGMLVLSDLHAEAGKSPTQWFDDVVQVSCDLGAVRIQDEKVFRVHYLESE